MIEPEPEPVSVLESESEPYVLVRCDSTDPVVPPSPYPDPSCFHNPKKLQEYLSHAPDLPDVIMSFYSTMLQDLCTCDYFLGDKKLFAKGDLPNSRITFVGRTVEKVQLPVWKERPGKECIGNVEIDVTRPGEEFSLYFKLRNNEMSYTITNVKTNKVVDQKKL